MIRKLTAMLVLVLLTQGCAAAGAAGGEAGDTDRGAMSRANLITQEELAEHPELASVAEAVRLLRPRWRDETIYVDNRPYVGQSTDILLTFVTEIRYLELSEAQMMFGQSIETNVIHVITR
jgi:hypothetical protein